MKSKEWVNFDMTGSVLENYFIIHVAIFFFLKCLGGSDNPNNPESYKNFTECSTSSNQVESSWVWHWVLPYPFPQVIIEFDQSIL